MKNFVLTLLAIAVVLAGYWFVKNGNLLSHVAGSPSPSASPTASAAAFDQSVSDGTITVGYPSAQFGLATTPGQVLVTSYIPPCEQGFNYCLYYNATQYQGTNFESAGLRIQKRSDISAERLCLNTPPSGYSATTTPAATASQNAYATSVFAPIGDAAAGHYSNGSLYRLFIRDGSKCYEFETRIGQTQYANYPAGSIKEFSIPDQTVLNAQLTDILHTVTLKDGTKVQFAQ